jgi:hypothetical protein
MPDSNNICFMDNQFLEASMLTVSSEDSDFPIENLLDPIRSRLFKPLTNVFNIVIDLGVNASVEFIGLVGPLSSFFGISDAATITIEANNINDFVTPPFTTTATPELTGVFKFIDDDNDFRYWKISIDDNTNPDIMELGFLYFGDYIQLADRTVSKGFTAGVVDNTRQVESMNGTLYYDEKQKYHRFNGLGLGYIPAEDRRLLEKMYFDNGKSTPMFVSLDPNLKISVEHGELTKLMVFDNAPSINHHFDDVYSMGFSLRESV